MISFVICDDDINNNIILEEYLKKIINKHKLNAEIALVTNSPLKVVKYSEKYEKRLTAFFLDIVFPKHSTKGIELAEYIRNKVNKSYIVFISGYQEYSILCFKSKPFDFLLKPVYFAKFEKCVISIYNDFLYKEKVRHNSIKIKSGSKLHVIKINNIIYFEKHKQILLIRLYNETIKCYESIYKMEEILKDHGFFRSHKSYLINTSKIDTIDFKKNIIFMENGERCKISQTKKKYYKMF